MAVEARKLEMQFFRSMKKVYDEVPRYGRTRWLQGYYDEVAGHQQRRPAEPELQGQVGKETKTDYRLDLFAATPPLESLE